MKLHKQNWFHKRIILNASLCTSSTGNKECICLNSRSEDQEISKHLLLYM